MFLTLKVTNSTHQVIKLKRLEVVMTAKMKPAIVALVPPSIRFGAFQAVMLFALLLLLPSTALAQGTNCPPEPVQNTPIYDGQIYIGTNCTLTSPGDVDSFIFDGSNGETYHFALAINGSAPVNICMTLYDPNEKKIFSGCTNVTVCVRLRAGHNARHIGHIYDHCNREFNWQDKLRFGARTFVSVCPQRARN